MPKTLEARLTTVEKTLNAPVGSRLEYGHGQLVLAVGLQLQGVPEAEVLARVGLPAGIVPPRGFSAAELVLMAAGTWSPDDGRTMPLPRGAPLSAPPDLPSNRVADVDAVVDGVAPPAEAPVRRPLTEVEALEADGVHAPSRPERPTHERPWRKR